MRPADRFTARVERGVESCTDNLPERFPTPFARREKSWRWFPPVLALRDDGWGAGGSRRPFPGEPPELHADSA
jgi:hypothetical protein